MAEFVEVKEKMDGSYSLWITEEGWLPCTCEKCKHIKEAPLRELYYKPKDLDEAKEMAKVHSDDIRVIPLKRGRKSEDTKDSKSGKSAKSD